MKTIYNYVFNNENNENINIKEEQTIHTLKLNKNTQLQKPKTKKERIKELEEQIKQLQAELDSLKPKRSPRTRSNSSSSSSSSRTSTHLVQAASM